RQVLRQQALDFLRHRPARSGTDGHTTAGSANRRPVLQTALRPQCVEAAHDLQRRALADVALETFAVIADVLDDAVRPIVGEAERFTILALAAEQPPRFRIAGF